MIDAAFFEKNYGLRLAEIELVSEANDLLFRAQLLDNQRVALKVFRSSNAPDAARLAALNGWLRFLKTQKIAAAEPSEFLLGEPKASIRRWSAGKKISRPTVAFCQKLGAATARLHVASEVFSAKNLSFETTRIDAFYVEKISKKLAPVASERGFSASLFDEKAAWLAAESDRIGYEKNVFGLVHSDLHFGNLLRKGSGALVVLDWDEIAWGPFLLDFGPIFAEFACFPAQTAVFEEAFLSGYAAHRALPKTWETDLRAMRSLNGLLAASWFFAAENAHVRAFRDRLGFGERAFSAFLEV